MSTWTLRGRFGGKKSGLRCVMSARLLTMGCAAHEGLRAFTLNPKTLKLGV